MGLKKEDINKSYEWIENKGNYAVFFGRFIPIIRSLVSIPAGMAKMALTPFLILTTLGSLIWNIVLIMLGRIAGKSWGKIATYIGGYSNFVLYGFIAIFVFGIVWSYLKNSKRISVFRVRKRNNRK